MKDSPTLLSEVVKYVAYGLAGANAACRSGFNPLGGAVSGTIIASQFNTAFGGTPVGAGALAASSAILGLNAVDFSPLIGWVKNLIPLSTEPMYDWDRIKAKMMYQENVALRESLGIAPPPFYEIPLEVFNRDIPIGGEPTQVRR